MVSRWMKKEARNAIKRPPPPLSKDCALFLDVDGTLIELASTPAAIHVDNELLGLMSRLYRLCGGALALISGRSVGDLEKRLGSSKIPLAGQHGLERRNADGQVQTHSGVSLPGNDLRTRLEGLTAKYPGLLLEDKGLSLALHYRSAPELAGWLHRQLNSWLIELGEEKRLQLQKGKYVLEIKPSGFDKGSAIVEFMEEEPFAGRVPLFIGDDITDERGFERVNSLGGLTVKVGRGKTSAHYRLGTVSAVRKWLSEGLQRQ